MKYNKNAHNRAATAGKADKVWSLPRFQYALIRNNQSKKICGRILDLAWLKFAVAALQQKVQ